MSNIDDLMKKYSAMKIKGSKAITLDIDYISTLLDDIGELEAKMLQLMAEDKKDDVSKNDRIVLHGGKFK